MKGNDIETRVRHTSADSHGEVSGRSVRNSSFELLRIVSVLLIIAMHIVGYVDQTHFSPFNHLVAGGLNIVGNTGVTCFVLISGYFGVSFKMHKFVSLVVLSSVYSLLVAYLVFGCDVKELLKALLIIPRYKLWFIVCYLFLMVLSPYLNRFSEMLDRKEYTRLMLTLTLLLCVVPSLFADAGTGSTVLYQGGKNLTYFLFIYLLGRYIRKYYDQRYSRRRLIALQLSLLALQFLLFTLLYYKFNTPYTLFYDCNILMLMSAVTLFFLFKSFCYHSSIINFVSSSVLAMYVLNGLYVFIDRTFIHIQQYCSSGFFAACLLAEVLAVALVAIVTDKTLGTLVRKVCERLVQSLNSRS